LRWCCSNLCQSQVKQNQICLVLSGERTMGLELSLSKARAKTFDVFGVCEHAWFANVTLVFAPVLFPFAHVIESCTKILTSNTLDIFFATITYDFDCFNCWSWKVSSRHKHAPFQWCSWSVPRHVFAMFIEGCWCNSRGVASSDRIVTLLTKSAAELCRAGRDARSSALRCRKKFLARNIDTGSKLTSLFFLVVIEE